MICLWAQSAAADEWRPAPVVDSRPQHGHNGPDHKPIYFNSINGHSQYEVPTMPAREFELDVTEASAYDRLMAFNLDD
jgi:hypothetical protein